MKLLKKIPVVVLLVIALFITSTLAWYVTSSGGTVKVRRINIAANDGTIASAVVYIPKSATDENPAPFVLNFAGRSTNAQYLATYAIEQAKRGFVSINVDVWGNGQTEFYDTPEGRTDLAQAVTYIEYARTLTFIDKTQMNIVGYSLGSMNAPGLAEPYIDDVNCICLVYMPRQNVAQEAPEMHTNWMIIRAAGDTFGSGQSGLEREILYEENLTANFELDEPIQRDTLYGSYADKTAREYVYIPNSFHQTATINRKTNQAVIRGLVAANPGANDIPVTQLTWGWAQFLLAVSGCLYVATVIAFGWYLLKQKFFSPVVQAVPVKTESPSVKSLLFQYGWAIIIPMLLFLPVGDWAMYDSFLMNNPVFRSNNLNGNFFPLVAFALISIVLILVMRVRRQKQGLSVGLADYGLAVQGTKKIPWDIIWRCVIMAFFVSILSLGWMFFIEGVYGINYQTWQIIIYNRTSFERFMMSFNYMPFFIISLGVPAITMNTGRRLRDTGNANRDLARDIAINFAIAALPMLLMLIIQYAPSFFTQTTHPGFSTWDRTYAAGYFWNSDPEATRGSVAALDFAWNVPFVMGAGAAINTFFYRKTGTIWPGVILGTVFTAITVCANYTLQA